MTGEPRSLRSKLPTRRNAAKYITCFLTARGFAMSFMSIAKPPLTIFLGFQAAFFIAG
jgi:hypothetical protein